MNCRSFTPGLFRGSYTHTVVNPHFIIIIHQQEHVQINTLVRLACMHCTHALHTCQDLKEQFCLPNQAVSIESKSRTLIVEILLQGCCRCRCCTFPRTIYIIHCLRPESRDLYKEQADRLRENRWHFISCRERERDGESMEYSMSSVSCWLEKRKEKKLLVQRSLFSPVIWIASAAEA